MKNNGSGQSVSCIKRRSCAWCRVRWQHLRNLKSKSRSARIHSSKCILRSRASLYSWAGGLMSQVQESLIDQTKSAAERPAKSESKLAVGLVSRFTMKDGTDVLLRPIQPSDEALMAQFHHTLPDRSVYMRYFRSLNLESRLAHERLVRICRVDGKRKVALVVAYPSKGTGQHQILGVGRLIKLDSQNEAEVAILVSDQYQKQGLGTELSRRLIQIARGQKLHRVSGELLRDNLAMQIIVKKLGFRFRLCSDGASIPAVLGL